MFYVFKTKSNKEEANPKLNAKINYSNCISKEYPLMKKRIIQFVLYIPAVYIQKIVYSSLKTPQQRKLQVQMVSLLNYTKI